MCRRYREQGLEEYTRNNHQSHHWLLSLEQEEEILNQFNDGTGKQVTANEIKAVLDEVCGKDIAEFMESGLEAELDDELGYGRYDYRNKRLQAAWLRRP